MLPLFQEEEGPGEILRYVDAKELEAGHTLHCNSVDADVGVCRAPRPPEVHNNLLGFLGVKYQALVSAPHDQVPYLIPVGRLVVTSDQTYLLIPHQCTFVILLSFSFAPKQVKLIHCRLCFLAGCIDIPEV